LHAPNPPPTGGDFEENKNFSLSSKFIDLKFEYSKAIKSILLQVLPTMLWGRRG